MPLGRWVMRTAESVLLTCWPASAARAVRVDLEVVLVDLDRAGVLDDRRDLEPGERRLAAVLSVERAQADEAVHALLGRVEAVGVGAGRAERRRLDPGLLPGLTSSSSCLKPRFSAHRICMRRTISAQSCASVPAAGVDGHEGVAGVVLAGEEAVLLELGEVLLDDAELVVDLAHQVGVVGAQLGQLDVALERAVQLELALRPRVLAVDPRRPLLVAPEVRVLHLRLELGDLPLERGRVEVLLEAHELLADGAEPLRQGLGCGGSGHGVQPTIDAAVNPAAAGHPAARSRWPSRSRVRWSNSGACSTGRRAAPAGLSRAASHRFAQPILRNPHHASPPAGYLVISSQLPPERDVRPICRARVRTPHLQEEAMDQDRTLTRALSAALTAAVAAGTLAGPAAAGGRRSTPPLTGPGATPPPHAAQPQAPARPARPAPPANAPAHGVRGTKPRRAAAPAPPAHAPAHGRRGTRPAHGPAKAATPSAGTARGKGPKRAAPSGNGKSGNGGGRPKVTLCHATGSATNPYVTITIAAPAVRAHDRHQNDEDIIPAPAGCPTAEGTAARTALDAARSALGVPPPPPRTARRRVRRSPRTRPVSGARSRATGPRSATASPVSSPSSARSRARTARRPALPRRPSPQRRRPPRPATRASCRSPASSWCSSCSPASPRCWAASRCAARWPSGARTRSGGAAAPC